MSRRGRPLSNPPFFVVICRRPPPSPPPPSRRPAIRTLGALYFPPSPRLFVLVFVFRVPFLPARPPLTIFDLFSDSSDLPTRVPLEWRKVNVAAPASPFGRPALARAKSPHFFSKNNRFFPSRWFFFYSYPPPLFDRFACSRTVERKKQPPFHQNGRQKRERKKKDAPVFSGRGVGGFPGRRAPVSALPLPSRWPPSARALHPKKGHTPQPWMPSWRIPYPP